MQLMKFKLKKLNRSFILINRWMQSGCILPEQILDRLFMEYEGTPLIKSFSLYGTLMKSIIHQQLNLSFSHTLTKRFVESFGEKVDGVWRYPSPERIASLDVSSASRSAV